MKNDETEEILIFKNSIKYRQEVAFDILLCGGPSNTLKDCSVCFHCGKKTVDEEKKLTKSRNDVWVYVLLNIMCLVY